ncbi:MFS transporter [Plantactinospora sp. KBS50]|uniref:MFS transporter n=1 Tax=Plantactinospora sp. KBS50 TaxID=2024580 RepID=UPI0021015BAA|nr:MFS transporter [Plantactinospora sp. KBS50]
MADAATYLISALLVLAVRRVSVPAVRAEADETPATGALAEFRAGAAYLFRHLLLRALLLTSSSFLLVNAAFTVLLVPYLVGRLGADGEQVGLLLSALGIGFLISAYVGRAISRSGRLRYGAAGCLAAVTVTFGGLFGWHDLVAAAVFLALAGVPGGAFLLLIEVQVQRQTPDHVLGRVSAAFSSTEMAATLLGGLLGGALAAAVGLMPTVAVLLILLALVAAAALVVLPDKVVAPDAAPIEPERTSVE